jgi:hypothetical protein
MVAKKKKLTENQIKKIMKGKGYKYQINFIPNDIDPLYCKTIQGVTNHLSQDWGNHTFKVNEI